KGQAHVVPVVPVVGPVGGHARLVVFTGVVFTVGVAVDEGIRHGPGLQAVGLVPEDDFRRGTGGDIHRVPPDACEIGRHRVTPCLGARNAYPAPLQVQVHGDIAIVDGHGRGEDLVVIGVLHPCSARLIGGGGVQGVEGQQAPRACQSP